MQDTHPGHKSLRLSSWAYNRPAHYFLTLCSHNRQCHLGRIVDGKMVLSACGEMVRAQLLRSLEVREELEIDTFQIMPNHLHLIVAIKGNATGEVGYARGVLSREAKSVSSFVAGFKAAVTSAIRRAISKNLTVWQRGFFDHIIRTERALMALRQYIMDNPRQWELDKLHPRWPASARDAVDEILESDSKFKR